MANQHNKKAQRYTSLQTHSNPNAESHASDSDNDPLRRRSLDTQDRINEETPTIADQPRQQPKRKLRRRSVVKHVNNDENETVLYGEPDEQPPQDHHHRIAPAVYLFAGCAAWNSCILGYDFGVNALSALLVQDALHLSRVELESYLGALDLFAMLGAAAASTVNDRYGRRGAFATTSIGFVVGAVVQATATNYTWLLTGRAFVGVAIGFGLAIDPIYISELAPADRRGELVSWSEIAINVGVVLGFSSGLLFYHVPDDMAWRYMFGMGALLPIPMLCLIAWVMPESPRWLVQKQREAEARQVLAQVYPDDVDGSQVQAVVKEIQTSLQQEQQAQHHQLGWKFLLWNPTPAYRRMLWTGVLAAVSQQVVGIAGIGNFLAYILNQSGLQNRFWQALALMGMQSLKTVVTLGASQVLDTVGRRPLCFASLAGMTVSLLILAADFALGAGKGLMTTVGLLGYLGFFGVGMGPCAWLIPSECFTNSIRANAMSVATLVNRLASTAMASTFLTLEKALTWSGVFLFLAMNCVVMTALIYWYVPETKGKTLEEMAAFFASITGDQTLLNMEETLQNARTNNAVSAVMTSHNGSVGTTGTSKTDSTAATAEFAEATIEMRTIV